VFIIGGTASHALNHVAEFQWKIADSKLPQRSL
jgi:hypothetical protein